MQQSGKTAGNRSRPELLNSLMDIVTRHVNEHMMATTTGIVGALLDATGPAIGTRTMFQRVKSGNLLKENSYAFLHLACTEVCDAVKRELDALAPAPVKRVAAPVALSLVPMEEMDHRLAFDSISRPFDVAHADALATLNVRVGYMLGRDVLRMSQNPFRPQVILLALQKAWVEFEPDEAGHQLIQPLLKPGLLFDFAPMYEALSLALMRKGVLPGSVDALKIQKTDNAAAARAARASGKAALSRQLQAFFGGGDAAPAIDADIPMIPLIPDLLSLPSTQQGSGWRPSAAAGFDPAQAVAARPAGGFAAGGTAAAAGAAPLPPGVQQLSSAGLNNLLGELQKRMPQPTAGGTSTAAGAGAVPHNVFYLPRLKQSLPQGSLSRGDEGTIDLLSRIFETVFLDDSIPGEIRELIQFLQIPVLRAALNDKNFFFEDAHPARRMIDLLSRMGWEQRKGADDPVFQAMQRGVDRIGRDAGSGERAFADAVADLEASIAADETAAESVIAEPIARALKQEKTATAARSAKNAVSMRIGAGEVVAVVEAFLENKWTSVLTVAYTVEDDKPGAVANATRTMDDLLWSVKPKVTHEQRKALIGKLPGLLATLNKWLDVIKWQDADRLQFFAELAECHASIVRAPLDLSPERQLEIAVEVAQADAIRRIEKEDAAAAQEEQADEAVITVDGLERGMWLEFVQPDAGVRKVKLAWVSPLRTLFIFSAGARQEAFSLSAESLAQSCRDGKARVIEDSGVVARALAQAMEGGAANDAPPGALRA
ncbi:DUF1631 family protein [Massilia cavernae]|uniref:DUF1631 family protein n=1 Tax=Massilia cavernae TaxID=2320864 RepID=UPI001E58BA5C|nr:DUF1631 family protein [Massilia cavernae]